MGASQSVPGRRSYDLFLTVGRKRLVWSYSDHGVTLADDRIAWMAGGRQFQAPVSDIVGVHLQLNYIRNDPIANCRLRFTNGSTLSVNNCNRLGTPDSARGGRYVEFVDDLHARARQAATRGPSSRPVSVRGATGS